MNCQCGYNYEPQPGESLLSAVKCPSCGRKIKKGETWIKPLGEMNMFEAVKFKGGEKEYLRKRKLKDGY